MNHEYEVHINEESLSNGFTEIVQFYAPPFSRLRSQINHKLNLFQIKLLTYGTARQSLTQRNRNVLTRTLASAAPQQNQIPVLCRKLQLKFRRSNCSSNTTLYSLLVRSSLESQLTCPDKNETSKVPNRIGLLLSRWCNNNILSGLNFSFNFQKYETAF